MNVDDFKVHENKDGSVDKTKTDLYLHLVDRKDNSILEVDEVLRLIDHNIEKLDYLFKVNKIDNVFVFKRSSNEPTTLFLVILSF